MSKTASKNPNDFILPDLGEGVHEGELISWKVQVGQAVKEGETLAEFETDKALCEVASPRDGVIAKLHGTPGEILHVGNPLVTYEGAGGSAAAEAPQKPDSQRARSASEGSKSNGAAAPSEEAEDAGTVVGKMSGAAAGVSAEAGKALATPAVRRLARDMGVNIDSVRGTGIGGRVLEKDVRGAPRQGGRRMRHG
jgi:pyruvate dehydrogenase E2 component (dihydrolipoamide acetyltransferase)